MATALVVMTGQPHPLAAATENPQDLFRAAQLTTEREAVRRGGAESK